MFVQKNKFTSFNSTPLSKDTTNQFKSKIKHFVLQNKALKQRVQRQSVRMSKKDATIQALKIQTNQLSLTISSLRSQMPTSTPIKPKALQVDFTQPNQSPKAELAAQQRPDLKPKSYFYNCSIITIGIEFQITDGLTYRQTAKVLNRMMREKDPNCKTPCFSTIRGWVQKAGLFRLSDPKLIPGRHLLIVDEAASIGQEKALQVLSVDLDVWCQKKGALTKSDVNVLVCQSKKSWTAIDIQTALKEASSRLEQPPLGGISDSCSVMLKAHQDYLNHIPDCTHKLANCIERYFKSDPEYILFQAKLGRIRQKLVCGTDSGLIAPTMRTKSRFLNLFDITDWLKNMLRFWSKFQESTKIKLQFIKEHEMLVNNLCLMIGVVKKLSKIFKLKGITLDTRQEIIEIFKDVTEPTDNTIRFEEDVLAYVDLVRNRFPEEECIICCSDIIETFWGKLKYRCQKISNQGLGIDLLSMANYGKDLMKEWVMEAMGGITVNDVKEWAVKNLVPSFGQSKRDLMKKLASQN